MSFLASVGVTNVDLMYVGMPHVPQEGEEIFSQDFRVLLGIGRNGHIGFNEPDDCFAKGTHCVELTESTIEANKRFFASEDEVPRRAYSMGLHTIMTAKKVLVVASGEDKAWAIRESCFGPVTPKVPGSILQLHNDAIVIADEAALSLCGDFL